MYLKKLTGLLNSTHLTFVGTHEEMHLLICHIEALHCNSISRSNFTVSLDGHQTNRLSFIIHTTSLPFSLTGYPSQGLRTTHNKSNKPVIY